MRCLPGNIPNDRPAARDRRRCPLSKTTREGFTLIELLIAIVIMMILTTITLVIVNQTTRDDKIAAASREVQAMLEGARDRALHAREPRGIRFLRSQNDNDIITSMVYIGAPGKFSDGSVTIGSNGRMITSFPPRWNTLANRGLIVNGARIRIGSTLYTIVRSGATGWRLTKPFLGLRGVKISDYQLNLAPTVLPGQEPRNLPQNVVIDIDHSDVPPSWLNVGNKMDLLFSPRGTVIGPNVARGHIHLLITGVVDVTGSNHFEPGDLGKEDAETIVTITTQTGSVSTHSVFSRSDPWRNAETGVETK